MYRVGKLFESLTAYVDRSRSDDPATHGVVRQGVHEVYLQLYFARYLESIGKEGGIIRLVEVVTLVAEKIVYACQLVIEKRYGEGVARFDERL